MKRFMLVIPLVLLLAVCALYPHSASALREIVIPENAESVDLNDIKNLSGGDVAKLTEILNAHTSLRTCDMSRVSMLFQTAVNIVQGSPQITFHLTLHITNKHTIDNLEETLDLDGMNFSRGISLANLRKVMTCMPNLKAVNMVNARFNAPDVEALMQEFPNVTFQWTVRTNGMTFRPGATAYSTLKGRQEPRYTAEDMAPVIRWCPDLLALDVGHNNVSDLSFLKAWPNLRRLIVVDSQIPVTDISPLAEMKDLEYVELFMQNITDLTPLANHTALLDLNLCHNNITDLTPLYSCVNLERLWISYNPDLSLEQINALQEALPGCHVEYSEWQSTGAGWREHPRYFTMYESFTSGTYLPFEPVATPTPQPTETPVPEPAVVMTPSPTATATPAPSASPVPGKTDTPVQATAAPLPIPDVEARDISKECFFNGTSGASHNLTDGTYSRMMETGIRNGNRGLQITAPAGETIGALYIQWGSRTPEPLNIQAMNENGEWVTVAQSDGNFYAEYIPVPNLEDLLIVNREDPITSLAIREMKVFTPGTPPENVQLWQKPGDKVDMMLIVGHPDDELLWFGGLLPYYGGEQQKNVLVICAAMNWSLRRLELLDALWACGVRTHPVFCIKYDFSTTDMKAVFSKWGGEEHCRELFTGYLRRYKPDVLVLHDVNGEYGHGIHKTVCYLGQTCAELAGDASAFPEQAAELGTWNVPKIYIHLYPENQIKMNWNIPLKSFSGKTALEVAADAMYWHKSQTAHGWAVTAGGEYDNSLFGLYRSLVGEDTEKNDFFENIPLQ